MATNKWTASPGYTHFPKKKKTPCIGLLYFGTFYSSKSFDFLSLSRTLNGLYIISVSVKECCLFVAVPCDVGLLGGKSGGLAALAYPSHVRCALTIYDPTPFWHCWVRGGLATLRGWRWRTYVKRCECTRLQSNDGRASWTLWLGRTSHVGAHRRLAFLLCQDCV